MRSCIAMVLLLLVGLVSSEHAAHSQPASGDPAAEAKDHFERGLALYTAKHYPAAIVEFQTAYGIDPRPEFLFAWAQAERLSGNCANAVERYRKFLGTHPPPAPAGVAKTHLANCEEILASQPQEQPVSPAQQPPVQARTELPNDSGPPIQPAPARSLSRQEGHRAPWYTDVLGGALVGAGVVGLGVGLWLFASSGSDADGAHSAANYDGVRTKFEDAQSKRTLSWVVMGAGSALVVAGVVRYVLRRDKSYEPPVALGPGGFLIAGRF